jgi:hypothetical protein
LEAKVVTTSLWKKRKNTQHFCFHNLVDFAAWNTRAGRESKKMWRKWRGPSEWMQQFKKRRLPVPERQKEKDPQSHPGQRGIPV